MLGKVAALKGGDGDDVGGCTFNYLIEVTPPLFSPVFPQAPGLQREACMYVYSVLSATLEIHSLPSPDSTSIQPSVLAPPALAHSDLDHMFFKPILWTLQK